MFAGKGRRGIYVLEYADGSMYVGQATDVVGRCNSHYRGSGHHEAWEDVVALRFAEVISNRTRCDSELGPVDSNRGRKRNGDVRRFTMPS